MTGSSEADNQLGITDLFSFDSTVGEVSGDGQGYTVDDGTDWFRRLNKRWPHPKGRAPYLRNDISVVVGDLAPLAPLVDVSGSEVSSPPTDTAVRAEQSEANGFAEDLSTKEEGGDA